MSKYPWDAFLTERDKAVFAAGGFSQRAGFGKRPAVIVVDVNYNFVGDKPEPIKEWSHSCGEEGWDGVHAIARILAAARPKGVPVIYTTGDLRDDGFDAGGWAWKNARTVDNIEEEAARQRHRRRDRAAAAGPDHQETEAERVLRLAADELPH